MNMWTYIIGVPIFCGCQVGQSDVYLNRFDSPSTFSVTS